MGPELAESLMMVAKGSKMSAESREKMAAAKRGKRQTPEHIAKRLKS